MKTERVTRTVREQRGKRANLEGIIRLDRVSISSTDDPETKERVLSDFAESMRLDPVIDARVQVARKVFETCTEPVVHGLANDVIRYAGLWHQHLAVGDAYNASWAMHVFQERWWQLVISHRLDPLIAGALASKKGGSAGGRAPARLEALETAKTKRQEQVREQWMKLTRLPESNRAANIATALKLKLRTVSEDIRELGLRRKTAM